VTRSIVHSEGYVRKKKKTHLKSQSSTWRKTEKEAKTGVFCATLGKKRRAFREKATRLFDVETEKRLRFNTNRTIFWTRGVIKRRGKNDAPVSRNGAPVLRSSAPVRGVTARHFLASSSRPDASKI
jgi:hypothetical protein